MSDATPKSTSEPRTWRTWQLAVASVVALLVGIGIGGAGGDDEPETIKSTEDVTTTERETTTTTVRRTTTTRPEPYVPAPADFKLTVVTTEQSCFGSAGCNVSYEIDLAYVGPRPLDPDDAWTLIYEVRGGDEQKIGNISVQGRAIQRGDGQHLDTAESEPDGSGDHCPGRMNL